MIRHIVRAAGDFVLRRGNFQFGKKKSGLPSASFFSALRACLHFPFRFALVSTNHRLPSGKVLDGGVICGNDKKLSNALARFTWERGKKNRFPLDTYTGNEQLECHFLYTDKRNTKKKTIKPSPTALALPFPQGAQQQNAPRYSKMGVSSVTYRPMTSCPCLPPASML